MADLAQKPQDSHKESSHNDRVLFTASITVPKHYSKKNAKTIGYRRGGGIGSTNRLRPYIRATGEAAMAEAFLVQSLQNRARDLDISEPIDLPVRLLCVLQLTDFFTKRRTINLKGGDLSNLIQGPEDAMVKAGILRDDGLITEIIANKEWGPENRVTLSLVFDDRFPNYPYKGSSKKHR